MCASKEANCFAEYVVQCLTVTSKVLGHGGQTAPEIAEMPGNMKFLEQSSCSLPLISAF